MSPLSVLDSFWSPRRPSGPLLGWSAIAIYAMRMLLFVSFFAKRPRFHRSIQKTLSVSTVRSVNLGIMGRTKQNWTEAQKKVNTSAAIISLKWQTNRGLTL
ncbi:hypothetical protein LTR59_018285, partial [Friedmanniomyces endolithicus]